MIGNQPYGHKPLNQFNFGVVKQGVCTDIEVFARAFAAKSVAFALINLRGGIERRNNISVPAQPGQVVYATLLGRKRINEVDQRFEIFAYHIIILNDKTKISIILHINKIV